MARTPTTVPAFGSPIWSNSNGVLTASTDNALCARLSYAVNAAMSASAGDSIDRGLALLAELKKQGFGVIYLEEPIREIPASERTEPVPEARNK